MHGPSFASLTVDFMLKITTGTASGGCVTIAIAGRLTVDDCEAIEQALNDAKGRGRHVTVDMAGIRLVDRGSVEYLAGIRGDDLTLINLPPYVSRWVEQISAQHESGKLNDQRRRQK